MTSRLATLTMMLACLASAARAAEDSEAKKTIVFLGNSITWQNFYPAFVESYFLRKRPDVASHRFVNLGVRGDTAEAALARLERDLAPLQADTVFVMLGMNDGGYGGVNAFLLRYYLVFMEELIERIENRYASRVVLLTPTRVAPVDYSRKRYNRMLDMMADELVKLGTKRNLEVIQLFDLFEKAWPAARNHKPPIRLMHDAIHPGPAGHLLIAERILEHLLPGRAKPPADITFDLSNADWKAGKTSLIMVHPHDNVYLPPAAAEATDLPLAKGFFASRRLVVSGLSGRVRLRVGGISLGVFTSEALSRGIELDRRPKSAWARQAYRLYRLLFEKWRLSYYLWDPRRLGADAWLSVSPPGWQAIDKKEAYRRLEGVLKELGELPEPAAEKYELEIERLE